MLRDPRRRNFSQLGVVVKEGGNADASLCLVVIAIVIWRGVASVKMMDAAGSEGRSVTDLFLFRVLQLYRCIIPIPSRKKKTRVDGFATRLTRYFICITVIRTRERRLYVSI